MNSNKTVSFCTLGCKVNQYETDAMKEKFESAGYEIGDFNGYSDIYIVNTCTVTNMADRKSRQMLHRARKKNPEAMVVAVGCYAQEAADELEKDPLIDLVVGNNLKAGIVDLVGDYLEEIKDGRSSEDVEHIHVQDMTHEHTYEELAIHSVSEHTRAFIKIQDGCNQFCSYCIIPYARGRVRSRKPEDILAEVKGLTAAGYKEIVLTGIHISSYGLDFDHEEVAEGSEEMDYGPFKASRLIDLMEALSKIEGLSRIRFGSLEPRIITDEFLKRLAALPQVCPHFHLSLQSGCDETLKRMNRHYSTALFAEKAALIRSYFDHAAIATDIIVGFPGETPEEFETTRSFLSDIHFADMHIFKYSKRKGTKAAVMPNQVDPQIQTLRSDVLLKLAETMHEDFILQSMGKTVEILTEDQIEVDGRIMMTGYTKDYIRCLVSGDDLPVNTLVSVKLLEKYNEEFVLAKAL